MSTVLINRNADLKQLRDEGYDVDIRECHLLLRNIPYVNRRREVARGTLVSSLEMAGDKTVPPSQHIAHFEGEFPCRADGLPIKGIGGSPDSQGRQILGKAIVVNHSFSNKPASGYENYYHKMTTYVKIIAGHATVIDPDATARTFPTIELSEDESVFCYPDTASGRSGIVALSQKLALPKIAIVGLGGTGSYILDLVAKTPVREIHIFDGDVFHNHNAFRAPGAPSLELLRKEPRKTHYLQEIYSRMRRGIVVHDFFIEESNISELQEMNFVFLSMDKGTGKRPVVMQLEEWDIPFVDVGMGITLTADMLGGKLRVTTSTSRLRVMSREVARIDFSGDVQDGDYSENIQIADLNALNAALAVIKWKKHFGFYRDLDHEHHTSYTIDGNGLTNSDHA